MRALASRENFPAAGTVTAPVGATKFGAVPVVDGIRYAVLPRTATPGAGSRPAGKLHPTPSKLPSVLVSGVATPSRLSEPVMSSGHTEPGFGVVEEVVEPGVHLVLAADGVDQPGQALRHEPLVLPGGALVKALGESGIGPSMRSMRPLRVAVVGCGTAGPALALMLHRDGHDVRLIERVAEPGPVGAGILLQHLGQEVLHRMGLGDTLRAQSPEVTRVDATAMDGRVVMGFDYADLPGGVPGWGVHRGTLLQTLLDAVRAEGVPLETGVTVTAVRPDDRGVVVRTDTAGDRSFDLVIGADGAASVVRRESGLARHDRVYPYGALWAVVDDPEQRGGAALYQRYHGTRHYLGTLPTGLGRSSVFWSIRERDIDSAMTEGVDAWREQARPFAGEHDYLLDRVTHLLPARYRHVGCRQPDRHHPHRDAGVVLLGDAAHGMSPQLGAGGSLALADAWTLAAMLRRHDSVTAALTAYRSQRRAHIRWYAFFSSLMVPAFQSDLDVLAWPRDHVLGAMTAQPWVRRIMVSTLMGAQTSPWSSWSLPD